jgi:hypothetical protein
MAHGIFLIHHLLLARTFGWAGCFHRRLHRHLPHAPNQAILHNSFRVGIRLR